MASTYSTSLRLELMATGDQSGTWGDTTNTNLGTLLEQSITGFLSKAMADTDQTLTNLNGASDEARNMIVEATGALTGTKNVIVPTAEKLYLFKNSTTGGFAVTIKTSAGTGVAVPMNGSRWVYCDGTNVVDGMSGPLTPTTSDSAALGTAAVMWSDLFLASGGVINWNNGALTLTQSTETLTQTFTDAGATVGPVYDLYRDSATPAAADIIGRLAFNGRDSVTNKQEYGSIEGVIDDPTSTSEDGSLDFYAVVAGTRTKIVSVGPNLDLEAVGQIKFPATANPSSNANTLDDYEEGTFTPTLTCGASGTITLNAGSILGYIKVGSMVTISGLLTVDSVSSPSGSIALGTLPFTSVNANRGYATVALWVSDFVGTAGIVWQAFISDNDNTANIGFYVQATGATGTNPSALIKAGTAIVFSVSYLTV